MKQYKRIISLNESNYDFIDEDTDFIDEDLNEADEFINEDDGDNAPEPPMDEEKLRIESLKLATNIAKLMSDVTPDDIIKIANTVAGFIRNNNPESDLSPNVTDMNSEEDFGDETEFEEPADEDTEE